MSTKKFYVQPPEVRLAEVDRLILDVCKHGCKLLELEAPTSEVDAQIEFLKHLYQRRDLILNEMKRSGATQSDAYAHLRGKIEVIV